MLDRYIDESRPSKLQPTTQKHLLSDINTVYGFIISQRNILAMATSHNTMLLKI